MPSFPMTSPGQPKASLARRQGSHITSDPGVHPKLASDFSVGWRIRKVTCLGPLISTRISLTSKGVSISSKFKSHNLLNASSKPTAWFPFYRHCFTKQSDDKLFKLGVEEENNVNTHLLVQSLVLHKYYLNLPGKQVRARTLTQFTEVGTKEC